MNKRATANGWKSSAPATAGWLGFVLVLGAYAATSFGWLAPAASLNLTANALGAVLLGYAALARRAWQPFVIYVVWTLIALLRFVVHF